LVEIVDDVASGKIRSKVWFPSYVVKIDLGTNGAGDVKGYCLEYKVEDTYNNESYIFRREVTKETIKYFKDNQPYDYNGQGAVVRNPYGFVPAVWVRHTNVGEDYGQPAIGAVLGKIDEQNDLASRVHDRLALITNSPVVIASGGTSGDLDDINTTEKKSTSEDLTARGKIPIIEAPEGTKLDALPLEVGPVLDFMRESTKEIEKDLIELTVYDKMRDMSTLTGQAATKAVKDVEKKVKSVQGNYDEQLEKLFQMVLTIGGWRANSGAWGPKEKLTPQQKLFLPFNLDSYDKGDVPVVIVAREFTITPEADKWTAEKTMVDAMFIKEQLGIPAEVIYQEMGYTEAQAKEWARKHEEEKLAMQQAQIPQRTGSKSSMNVPDNARLTDSGRVAPYRANPAEAGVSGYAAPRNRATRKQLSIPNVDKT
jgi:hypothetical protein